MSVITYIESFHLSEFKIWSLIAVSGLLVTVLGHYLEIFLYQRTKKLLKKSKSFWTKDLVWALHKPLGLMIWLWGVTYAGEFAKKEALHPQIFFWIVPFRDCGAIILITWFLLRLFKKLERRIFDHGHSHIAKIDKTTAHALAQVTRILIIFSSSLVLLKYFFSISFTGLWAIGGAGSIIVGLAAKDLLANFFGAIMIYFDRPFSIGDSIRSSNKELEGCVESIGWRLTCIRTADKSPLYIPNSVFATMCIENTSLMTSRLINETIKIRYQDIARLEEIITSVRDMLHNHHEIDNSKSVIVNLVTFGSSSLEILVYCFTNTIERIAYQQIKQEILLNIFQIVHAHGAEFAIPTHNLTLPNSAEFMLSKSN